MNELNPPPSVGEFIADLDQSSVSTRYPEDENGEKKYRLSLNVTGLTFNRKKLVKHENGRVRDIAKKLP